MTKLAFLYVSGLRNLCSDNRPLVVICRMGRDDDLESEGAVYGACGY